MIPTPVIKARQQICRDSCVQKCEAYLTGKIAFDDCRAACPRLGTWILAWGAWGDCDGPKQFGLGDLVASVAQPIARGIDAVAGTKIAGCGGCAQRQAALNKLVPNIKP